MFKPLLLCTLLTSIAAADDVVTFRHLSAELAADAVKTAVMECRNNGYQVSAVAVDRAGNVQALLRDNYASRFTTEIAQRKADTVILSGVDSGSFRKNREDIRQELNHIDGLIVMEGGVPILAAGSLIGAIGVSGAPGGDKDAVCATAAVHSLEEKLAFVTD